MSTGRFLKSLKENAKTRAKNHFDKIIASPVAVGASLLSAGCALESAANGASLLGHWMTSLVFPGDSPTLDAQMNNEFTNTVGYGVAAFGLFAATCYYLRDGKEKNSLVPAKSLSM